MEFALPVSADLYLTHICNLHCNFCYYRDFQKAQRRDIPTKHWEAIIDELSQIPIFRVGIPGGEPFCRADLFTLLERIVTRRMRFLLNTNGTLVTEAHVTHLAELGQCDAVVLSLDGLEAEHDAIRGTGNWKKTVRTARWLKHYGIPLRVNMVLTNGTWQRCDEACRFICEELNADLLRIVPVNDVFAPLAEKFSQLSVAECAQVIAKLVPLAKLYPAFAQGGSPFLSFYRQIQNPNPAKDTRCKCCGLLWRGVTIRADGAIICCPNGEDKVLGWTGHDRIIDVWNGPLMTELRERAKKGITSAPDECQKCEYHWYCMQSCPASPREADRTCLKKLKQELTRWMQ